jgi:hypothetical protein
MSRWSYCFWPTSDRQSAAVIWLVQLLTSIGVAPSLATFSRLNVLMNAAIVAQRSRLDGVPACRLADLDGDGFVAAVLVETVLGVLLPARSV